MTKNISGFMAKFIKIRKGYKVIISEEIITEMNLKEGDRLILNSSVFAPNSQKTTTIRSEARK